MDEIKVSIQNQVVEEKNMMDLIVKVRPAIVTMIMTRQMIPHGCSIQREFSDVQHNPGPVEGVLEKKMIITGKWNSQRKTRGKPNQDYQTKQLPC